MHYVMNPQANRIIDELNQARSLAHRNNTGVAIDKIYNAFLELLLSLNMLSKERPQTDTPPNN